VKIAEGMTFQASHAKPGTVYVDEPSEEVPTGWYVVGSSQVGEGGEIALMIVHAFDADGREIDGDIARRVAALLNAALAETTP
jgi:hypothetical protein